MFIYSPLEKNSVLDNLPQSLDQIMTHLKYTDDQDEMLALISQIHIFSQQHYSNISHPTGKSYIEYSILVAMELMEIQNNPLLVAATLLCPPPPIAATMINIIKKEFKAYNEIVYLIEQILLLQTFEVDIWSSTTTVNETHETKERAETLRKMQRLAIDEQNTTSHSTPSSAKTHTTSAHDLLRDLLEVEAREFQKKEKQVENTIRMLIAIPHDIYALIIKLVDRLVLITLLKDLDSQTRESFKYQQLAKITLALYAPLADRLGIWQLKSKLEDMSFRLIEPEKYKSIAKQLSKKREREENIQNIITQVNAQLASYGIEKADIEGRVKHIYSIYRKMEAKQLSFNEINDLFGIRIIVDTREACYDVQDIIHALWPPVKEIYGGESGRDWIKTPKDNGYQSLHTTINVEDKLVEVQIRTHEMHEIAEFGVAAEHWRYKGTKAYRKGKTPRVMKEKDQDWGKYLADLKRSLTQTPNPDSSNSKSPSGEQIFVITPIGHVIDLPAGSTPLDFAYRIHTDIGHTYRAAKVNGRLVGLDYVLKSGDIIEIIISRARKGPNPEWLKGKDSENGFVKTRQARGKISHWLHKQEEAQKTKSQK